MRTKKPLTPEQKQRKKEHSRKWNMENHERVLEKQRKWRKNNLEKVAEYAKKSRLKDSTKAKKYQKEWALNNKEHLQKKLRKWYCENIDRVKDSRLRRVFGISLKEYNDMLDKQNGVCNICGEKEIEGKYFSVDHDHKTGKIRGLLCSGCNVGIGNLKDDPELLRKAIIYIENFRNSQ